MARLVKGQTAPGVLAISEAALGSVRKRAELFERIRNGESIYSEHLRFFESVQLLADWDAPALSISPISVKTLRKYILRFYPDGLAAMCRVARSIQRIDEKSKKDQSGGHYKLQSELAIDSALEMTARYLDLVERLKKLSRKDRNINKELEQHFRKFGRNPHIQEVC